LSVCSVIVAPVGRPLNNWLRCWNIRRIS
jgi:ABC-type antimicrobial peptide transport system, permease component